MKTRGLLIAALVAVVGMASCTVHDVGQLTDPPVPIPQRFSATDRSLPPERWWEEFNDPTLNSLIAQALSGNLELKSAWTRLDQARALAVQAGAAILPEVTAEAGVSRTRVNKPTARAKDTGNLFSVGLAASYELDLWGRVRSVKNAAEMDLLATRENLDATAISLAAAVGETWFSLVEQRAQKGILTEQADVSKTFLELAELRFSQGRASALDVYQQRLQLAATRSRFAPVEARLKVLQHQLAVLLGRPPRFSIPRIPTTLPELPPPPGSGLPADLLRFRPDLRAAYHQLSAADHRVAIAVADRLPALRLTAGASYQGDEVHTIFDNWIWNIAGNLAAPVFDAGRRKAEVARTRAAVTGLLQEYGRVVLGAFQEVEDALVQERQERIFLADLDHQIGLARATLSEARARYVNGLSDYLPVLTALQVLQKLERERLTAQRRLISFRIQLYRALGGSWMRSLEPSVTMQSARAEHKTVQAEDGEEGR